MKGIKLLTTLLLFQLATSSYGQHLEVTLADASGAPIEDAVIEVVLPAAIASQYAAISEGTIDQVDKEFVPTITTIVAGSKIHFPNSDDILHHVYSFSPIDTFDIPLYGNDVTARFVEEFPLSGVVEIGCNIHDWMLAYIYIAESSKVAISDDAGKARIENLPAGTYPVRVWHARLPRGTEYHMETVTLQNNTVELQVSLDLERDRRIRRAPTANSNRYR